MTTVSSTSSSSSTETVWEKYLEKQAAAVSSASSSTSSSVSANLQEVTSNFETFIKILTTQLQNQDPTSATDTSQFTEELVQFSQVEQQLATNSKLDTLTSNISNYTSVATSSAAASYIGKYVQSSTTTTDLIVQNGTAAFAYSLSDTPSSVAIKIYDSSGSQVATMSGPTTAGLHRVEWDGTETTGVTTTDGTYTVKVTETGSDGTASSVSAVYLVGQVTAVNIDTSGNSSVSIGDSETLDVSSISSIFDTLDTSSSSSSSTTSSS